MPNVIEVTPSHVRALIDLSLDDQVLPDAVIILDIYRGAAILEVQEMDVDWATRNGAAAQHLDNAADLLTAARVVFAVPALTAEDYGGEGYRREALDAAVVADRLRSQAQDEVNAAIGAVDPVGARPTIFGVAHGIRGW